MTSIVITTGTLLDGEPTYTVHATRYDTGLTVKSCLWRTVAAAEAEAKRIEASWRYETDATMGKAGAA